MQFLQHDIDWFFFRSLLNQNVLDVLAYYIGDYFKDNKTVKIMSIAAVCNHHV